MKLMIEQGQVWLYNRIVQMKHSVQIYRHLLWIVCTKMWLFLGMTFSLGILIPGKLCSDLQYDG